MMKNSKKTEKVIPINKDVLPVKEEESDKIVVEGEEGEKKFDTIDDFVSDKEEQANARRLAAEIQEVVSKNWFDYNKYMKKTKRGPTETRVQLSLLHEFGLCVIKYEGKKPYFKIVFDTIEEQKLIHDEISHLELRIKVLKNKLEKLKQKQVEIEKGATT